MIELNLNTTNRLFTPFFREVHNEVKEMYPELRLDTLRMLEEVNKRLKHYNARIIAVSATIPPSYKVMFEDEADIMLFKLRYQE